MKRMIVKVLLTVLFSTGVQANMCADVFSVKAEPSFKHLSHLVELLNSDISNIVRKRIESEYQSEIEKISEKYNLNIEQILSKIEGNQIVQQRSEKQKQETQQRTQEQQKIQPLQMTKSYEEKLSAQPYLTRGDFLVVLRNDLKVIEIKSNKTIAEFARQDVSNVRSVSDDGQFILMSSDDRRVHIYNNQTKSYILKDYPTDHIKSAQWSSDWVFFHQTGGGVFVNLQSGFVKKAPGVFRFEFFSSGVVIEHLSKKDLEIWNSNKMEMVAIIPHEGEIVDWSVDLQKNRIFVFETRNHFRVYDLKKSDKPIYSADIPEQYAGSWDVTFSPSHKHLMIGNGKDSTYFLDAETYQPLPQMPRVHELTRTYFLGDNRLMRIYEEEYEVYELQNANWVKIDNGRWSLKFPMMVGSASFLTMLDNNTIALAHAEDGTIYQRHIVVGGLTFNKKSPLILSRDHTWVATINDNDILTVYELKAP